MQFVVRAFFLAGIITGCALYIRPDLFSAIATVAKQQQTQYFDRSLSHVTTATATQTTAPEAAVSDSLVTVKAQNLIDFKVNGRQYHLPLDSHKAEHVEDQARFFCIVNRESLGIAFVDREKSCVRSISNYISSQIHPAMQLQMEFAVTKKDTDLTVRYEVFFDPSVNTGSDVAISLCQQKAADIGVTSDEELRDCVKAMEESLDDFIEKTEKVEETEKSGEE